MTAAPAEADQNPLVAGEIATELVRLIRLVERGMLPEPGDLDRPSYMLMARLSYGGPARVSALAEAVHSDPSTVSRQVAQLVELGMVERTADPRDRRATLLVLTADGNEQLQRARRRWVDLVDSLVADWPKGDRERLATLLAQFSTEWERYRVQCSGGAG